MIRFEGATMLLTHSSIAAFKTCRRRYKYRYVDGIEQKDRPIFFDFGTAVHLALAGHYKGDKPDVVLQAVDQYFADNQPGIDDPERIGKWNEARELVMGMFNGYIQRYPSETFKPLVIEREFNLPILDVRGEKYEGIRLAGKVDMVAEENGLWVVEHKSASQISTAYKRKLTLDAQSMLYLEAMEREYGKRFNGVIYNVLAKAIPEMPAVLKKGGLSQAKSQNTTPELYLKAIADNGLNQADYTEFLAYLEANRKEFFYREYLTFSDEEREEWRRELWQIAHDIERATETDSFYRNTAACVGFGTCPYFDVCTAPDKDFVIDNSYVKKEIHAELDGEVA
jgi:hypothetical protein